MHVTRSHFAYVQNGLPSEQVIDVLINGKKLELYGETRSGLLMPGGYKAKLTKNVEKHGAFQDQTYVFLFQDNDTEPFWLYGEGE